jgi:pimeloyl-ACP methyl ester carboxylesterase
MVRKHDPGVDGERKGATDRTNRVRQPVDVPRQQVVAAPRQQVDGEEAAAAGNAMATIVGNGLALRPAITIPPMPLPPAGHAFRFRPALLGRSTCVSGSKTARLGQHETVAIGELCRFDAVAFPPSTQQVVTPPKQDMEEMAARMPHCRLTVVPGVGHSMIVERPEMYAQYFVEFFHSGKG